MSEPDPTRLLAPVDPTAAALSTESTASHPARLESLGEAVTAVRAAQRAETRVPIMLGGRLAAQPAAESAVDLDWRGNSLVAAVEFARVIAPSASATEE